MVVGFTGTRQGMTGRQRGIVADLLAELSPSEVCHGDCKGADAEFHQISIELKRETESTFQIHLFPGHNRAGESPTRAFCRGGDVVEEPKFYLTRDEDIVKNSEVMLATPNGPEIRRSGTWTTIRKARKHKVPCYIIYPDGHVDLENAD